MKTLLLHVPKFNNYYKPIGDFVWLTYMPMGLLAIADYAASNGEDVEVINLGVEWALDREFDVAALVRNNPEVRAVGLTLHWHHQSYDTIEAARRIKEVRDDVFVFLGGDTASFFHKEIIEGFSVIDAVIRGHGEEPLLSLIRALDGNMGLSDVPNLTWRENGLVMENPFLYVADENTLGRLNYTNFSLLRHADTCIRYFGLPFFFAKGFGLERNFKMFTLGSPMFPVPIGRGCPFNCTWCAGSHIPQLQYINRLKGFIYRSQHAVVESVAAALDAGYRLMHSCMDPEPWTQDYFIDLWQMMRKEKIRTDWIFECNGLPSDRFVEEFNKTFPGRDSVIVLSPETGNEAMRIKHKGPGFTNRALFEKLDFIDRLGVTSELFFTYGLPGENRTILEDTISLQRQLRNIYRRLRAIRTLAVEMEPGSPWHLEPDRFGIVTDRKGFMDFYRAHSASDQGAYTSFGYYIPGYFEKPLDQKDPFGDFAYRMQRLKCGNFCFIHPNPRKAARPWQGRMFCAVASRMIRLKPRDRSKPY